MKKEKGKRKARISLGKEIAERKDWGKRNEVQRQKQRQKGHDVNNEVYMHN